jgi:hypothetical protein
VLTAPRIGRFELFLDLLYVAILANFAETLAEDISGAKLVKYIVSVYQHSFSQRTSCTNKEIVNLGWHIAYSRAHLACLGRPPGIDEFIL